MNTNALFDPPIQMLRALLESQDEGLSRIEISYYAGSIVAENHFFPDFAPECM